MIRVYGCAIPTASKSAPHLRGTLLPLETTRIALAQPFEPVQNRIRSSVRYKLVNIVSIGVAVVLKHETLR